MGRSDGSNRTCSIVLTGTRDMGRGELGLSIPRGGRPQALSLIWIRHGKGALVEKNVSHSALSDVLITFFPHQNTDRLRDLVEARGLLEGKISGPTSHKATAGNLKEHKITRAENLADVSKPEQFDDLDYAFHHQIVDNSFLLLMHEALGPHIRSFINASTQPGKDRCRAHGCNVALLDAITSRNPKTASKMTREHLQPCVKSMTQNKDVELVRNPQVVGS